MEGGADVALGAAQGQHIALCSFFYSGLGEQEIDIGDEEQLREFMISSKSAITSSPSPGQLVPALTLSAAGDRWGMERMEILGDAFLKYSTTIFLHYKMVESYDEGYLSLARSEIVGNANFFHIGEDLGLASCRIVSTRMDPMERWTPGYQSTAMWGETDPWRRWW